MKKIAIDFGTTNTVIAVWREALAEPETLRLPNLSVPDGIGLPPLIPSEIYVTPDSDSVLVGYAIQSSGLDMAGDDRLFRGFKRGIGATVQPLPRILDDKEWGDHQSGRAFLQAVLQAIAAAEGDQIEELVLTVPIHSFEGYLKWLRDEAELFAQAGADVRRLRVVDESTAAALGYEVRTPGELVLVFDFGGGTLDVSLVRMPMADESGGIVFDRGRGGTTSRSGGDVAAEARVIAKSGRVLGGDDIDHWLFDEVLRRNDLTADAVADIYWPLKSAVEAAKIQLSADEQAQITVLNPDTYRTIRAEITRTQFEDLLDEHEFYTVIRKTVDKVMRAASARGIYNEDVAAVLMVGGSSQIPSVQRMIRSMFGRDRIFSTLPFEAVAHGALGLAAGIGLDDYIYHSYGIRHLSPITGRHEWEEIIPAGTRYPMSDPVRLVLAASRDGQEVIELVIGEVSESFGSLNEVRFGPRSILLVGDSADMLREVVPMNDQDGARTVAILNPPGRSGEDRVEVEFNVDANRTLRVSVRDVKFGKLLLNHIPVVELR